jgi:hypothetical protein
MPKHRIFIATQIKTPRWCLKRAVLADVRSEIIRDGLKCIAGDTAQAALLVSNSPDLSRLTVGSGGF